MKKINNNQSFEIIKKKVIDAGICSHCGSCIGLYPDVLSEKRTDQGPIPIKNQKKTINDKKLIDICPGKGISYCSLNKFIFNKSLSQSVIGNYIQGYVGYTKDKKIRNQAASGGITTAVLVYLLKNKFIDGAVVLKHGSPKPWLSQPIIVQTEKDIILSSQSVYIPIMTNMILSKIKKFKGRLAYVGLPDQVASIRKLQQLGNKSALKIKYILGPYMGTAMYLGSVTSFLNSKGGYSLGDIKSLRYRAGEWPGYLRIDLKNGQILKIPKFYYNYLIPFYISKASLLSVDFTNELTDISVGDAWSPKYEKQGKGFSVVLGRTRKGISILKKMEKDGEIFLEKKKEIDLINMHGHMLDFKKRGSFIRIKFIRLIGKKTPKYDYKPVNISLSRYLVEIVILTIFMIGKTKLVRNIVKKIPTEAFGRLFDKLRTIWKKLSKSTKRKGLSNIKFQYIK